MRITFCGTGGGGVTAERGTTCILVDDGTEGVLLDCGPGTIGALFRAKFALPAIKTLIVSHLHMDHIHGFPAWLAHMVFPSGVVPAVYGPPGTAEYVDLAARATAMVALQPGRPMGSAIDVPVTELDDGAAVEAARWSLRSVVVPHAPELVALAHRLTMGDRTVVFSGDTRADPGRMVPLAEGVDVLIHEVYSDAGIEDWTRRRPDRRPAIVAAFERTHTRVGIAAQIASEAGVGRLVLTHLNPGEVPERLKREAANHFGGEIVVATDGLSLEV